MGEGLKAFHEITRNINNQDEKIWRQTAAKKCLKKEFEKMEEQSKRYEVLIATLKKDPLYKKHEEFARLLEDNMKEHIQTHKLVSLAINAQNEETERKIKDIKSWDEKYEQVISDLKEAYDLKKKFMESTNPTYKKFLEIEASRKGAEVLLKQLTASSERRRRSEEQLESIKEKIFHKTILNFVNAVIRKKKHQEISSKLKVLADKKIQMVRGMFEAQEAMKKLRVRPTQIPSAMFTRRVPNLPASTGIWNRNEKRSMIELPQHINQQKRIAVEQKNPATKEKTGKKDNSETIIPPTPKRHAPNRLNIISNKIIALPPLKTILSRQRSRMNTSLNRSLCDTSFTSPANSQTDKPKKPDTSNKLSQENQAQTDHQFQNVKETAVENKTAMEPPPTKMAKPSDYLKNLKFTSQSNKFNMPKITSSPLCKQPSQANVMQKTSILKSQAVKRRLNTSIQEIESDLSQRKREKNVNFASPIQQHREIDHTLSSNEENSSSLNATSNMNTSGFLDEPMALTPANDEFTMMGNPEFSFGPSSDIQSGKNHGNGTNMTPMSIFGETNDTGSFGFSFGGLSKTDEMWDLFG
ncbi:golgin IMH1-like [Coccinella septempunctata]|uniref:golgin IMH1-like n=1 Tax=Coccinella septempunctata TaxID=41139 RepID=UPI001D07FAB1|nr:golgin IMH1-like [Coccinella septempunctata]XP_044761488.1 golgin IMH1-like [Coccinella septempunctata]